MAARLYLGLLVILTFSTNLIFANFAYVANLGGDTVFVIDTSTNNVIATITVGVDPSGVAITPNGQFAYVTNSNTDNVSVIDTSTNHVIATVPVGAGPFGIAITPNGQFAYVANSTSVSVINTSTNTVIATVLAPLRPNEIAITSDSQFAYVTISIDEVLVIDTATNMIIATINAGDHPFGIAITPTPLPPKNLKGRQKKNDFGVSYELFNKLSWEANTSGAIIAGYIVFRNGVKIATLSPFALEFEDHDIKKHASNTYSIISFDAGGIQSTAATVTIR